MRIYIVLFFLVMNLISLSQHIHSVREIDKNKYASEIKELEKKYGKNKVMPEKYMLQILIALSYFPELKETHITFKEAKISTTLNARPKITSVLFNKRKNRKYIVRINNSSKDSIVTIDEVPFNATIGLFGHEFSHFADYMNRGTIGIIKRAYSYTKASLKERFEKEIDLHTINRGLGWQLYDWAYYVLYSSDASEKYKKFKERIYLEPAEIAEYIDIYKHTTIPVMNDNN